MMHMDHILNLGFPIEKNDFPLEDWEMHSMWKSYLSDERQFRQKSIDERNRGRKKLGLDPINADAY